MFSAFNVKTPSESPRAGLSLGFGGRPRGIVGGRPTLGRTHSHTYARERARAGTARGRGARPAERGGGRSARGPPSPGRARGPHGGKAPEGANGSARTAPTAAGSMAPRAGGGRWARARGGGGEGVVRMRAPRWGPVCTEGDRCHLALRTRRWASPGDPRDVWRVLSPGWDSHRGPE